MSMAEFDQFEFNELFLFRDNYANKLFNYKITFVVLFLKYFLPDEN